MAVEQKNMDMQFTGGKMFHLFNQEESMAYLNQIGDEAKEALAKGTILYKIDGSNHRLVKEGDQWFLEARYDDKKGRYSDGTLPEGVFELPQGGNPAVYTNHHYYYTRLSRKVNGKKMQKLRNKLYEIVDRSTDRLNALGVDCVTCEIVGRKFNATPGVDSDCEIALHCEQFCPYDGPRTWEGIRTFLSTVDVEGLIFVHEGKCWKIHSDKFWSDCWWAKRNGSPEHLILPVTL